MPCSATTVRLRRGVGVAVPERGQGAALDLDGDRDGHEGGGAHARIMPCGRSPG